MNLVRVCCGAALAASVSAPAGAELPMSYSPLIYARQNFAANPGGAYNIPGGWFNSGETPALNDLGQVTFRLSVTSGLFQSIWFGEPNMMGTVTGAPVYNSVNDAFLSATSLNNQSRCVWETQFTSQSGVYESVDDAFFSAISLNHLSHRVRKTQFDSRNGVYQYQRATMTGGFVFNRPLGASGWGSPQINNNGIVGFYATFAGSGTAFVSYDPMSTAINFHVADVGVDPLSPFSFLFTPSVNNASQIGAKARRGGPGQTGESQPDEIRLFNADGSSVLIAQDRDANPASIFARFDNSVSAADNGWVAFTASLFPFPSAGRGVFLSNGATTITIATTTAPGTQVSDIEFFAPAMNNSGQVAFRAKDLAGLRAVWVGHRTGLLRVATEHDIIATDLGPARIDQHDSSPTFAGGVSINEDGDVAFNATLTPPSDNQIEWGTGTFVARALFPPPVCRGDADWDGVVGLPDLAVIITNWAAIGMPGASGDLDGDGRRWFDDLEIVIKNWGASCP